MVLVTDDAQGRITSPLTWPLARILRIIPGNDGVVRAAHIKTAKGEYDRPIVKLRKLPIDQIELNTS